MSLSTTVQPENKNRISKELFHNFGLIPKLRLPIAKKKKTTEANLKAVLRQLILYLFNVNIIFLLCYSLRSSGCNFHTQ